MRSALMGVVFAGGEGGCFVLLRLLGGRGGGECLGLALWSLAESDRLLLIYMRVCRRLKA